MRTLLALGLLAATACGGYAHDSNIQGRFVVQSGNTVPTCADAIGKGDACIEDDLQINGTQSGGLRKMIAGGASYTVSAPADCGAIITTATDNGIVELPAVSSSNAGCVITLINTAADDAALVRISPAAADGIYGSCVGVTGAGAATTVASGGVDNKDFNNTKAGANKGDRVTVVSDGSTGWFIVSCVGAWASE